MNNSVTNGFSHYYVPPKPLQLGSTTVAPVASTASEFDVQAYVEEAARVVGLPVDSPQVVQAVTILKSNGFVSRTLLESLTEKIALDYLKLPIVVWVCLTQHKASMELAPESPSSQQQQQPALGGRKRSLEEEPATAKRQDDFSEHGHQQPPLAPQHQQPAKKVKRDAEETATAATVAERITQYCQEVGHDPAFFQVKSVNSVCCLVCNKTFKLHGRGQITRVKRHIKGEGKKGLSRHMHNLLSVKEKLRTQQLPMMWQIPVHILQQVQQACPSMGSASAYAPPRGASSVHLLPNILPARGRSPSPSPSSATTSPGSSPLPSPASSSTTSTSSTPSTCSSSGLLHFPPVAGPAAAVAAAQRLRACAGGSGSPHFPAPLLSHAMAAVPSLEMLQAPPAPSTTTADGAGDSTTRPSSPPTMSAGVDRLSARLLLNGQRRQLDSDTGLVHCHCLAPAKPVLVRDAGASSEGETDVGDRTAADDNVGGDDNATTNDNDNNGDDQPTVAGGRRFYVCPRRQSDEGCTFIKSDDSSFVQLLDDDRFEELDLHEASLQGYVDQNLVPDDDETGASVTTADYDDFATTNDEDDEEGGLIIDHDDFHPEDLDDVGLQLEAGAVESPSTSLVMAMISSDDPSTSSSSERAASLRDSQQQQMAGDDDEAEQEAAGQVEEREHHRRQLAGVADDESGSAEMTAVELNEGGSEGIS